MNLGPMNLDTTLYHPPETYLVVWQAKAREPVYHSLPPTRNLFSSVMQARAREPVYHSLPSRVLSGYAARAREPGYILYHLAETCLVVLSTIYGKLIQWSCKQGPVNMDTTRSTIFGKRIFNGNAARAREPGYDSLPPTRNLFRSVMPARAREYGYHSIYGKRIFSGHASNGP